MDVGKIGSRPSPGLTVAVCTRERTPVLGRALESIRTQTSRPETILVVDNAPSTNRTRTLIESQFPEVRYVREEVEGLDFARNRALREADEDVVAFLDDDAVAHPTWVEETRAVFAENTRVGLCTGRVEPLRLDTPGQRMFEANGGFSRGDRRIVLPPSPADKLKGLPAPLIAWSISVGSGCSLAVRRTTALDLGGFDEALDLGSALPGGGDLDFIWRMVRAGHEVVYEPRVRAQHDHRERVDDTVDQILGHNKSLIVVLEKAVKSTRGTERAGVFAFLAWRLVKPYVRLMRKAVGRDPLPASALLRLPGACWSGLGTYASMQALAKKRATISTAAEA